MTTRRNFLKNTTMLAAGLGVSPLLSSSPLRSYQKEEVINGKVRIAVIGVGMGCRDLQGALTDNPWVHCVGMCDVNKVRLEEQLARFKKDFPEQTVSIKAYTDFREVLANKEIDGVIIATPDHWHPYIFAEIAIPLSFPSSSAVPRFPKLKRPHIVQTERQVPKRKIYCPDPATHYGTINPSRHQIRRICAFCLQAFA